MTLEQLVKELEDLREYMCRFDEPDEVDMQNYEAVQAVLDRLEREGLDV